MIDINTGHIVVNFEIKLGPDIDFEVTNSFNIDKSITDFKNGYKWIHFENLKVNELYLNVNVCFHNEKTKMITFVVSETEFKAKRWENWSEQEEMEKIAVYENWLTTIVGVRREFNWGKISIDYDIKGGRTTISILYNKQKSKK
ncbi:hypothetical protein [Flavobacterium sp.]|uniref:hypothetical protein n=1 Tax=Flavobacterium sp. TaxID=239 RepID=UPI00260D7D60|nr:hypothetical protein [Flavobacterium sp.]